MGKFKRIPVKDIRAMQKILDDLPDKNLGKTREEAVELLNANILKALEKGYTLKVLPAKAAPRKREPKPRPETVKPVAAPPAAPQSQEEIPDFYTPDKPDTEL